MKTANAKKSASTKSAPKAVGAGANGSTMTAALRAPIVVDADAYVAEHGHLLAGLPAKRIRISVVSLCSDANTLLEIAAPRRDRIIGAGCEARFLDELPMRVALAQACQTLRQSSRISYSSAERASIDECQAHRNEMMRVCRHAFRKDADVQKSLTGLQEGTGVQDLLEDSRALRHHILQSPEAVRSTGFDPEALVAQALAHEEAITSLATTRTVRVKGGTLAVTLRNQAVHFLLEAMREVRDNAAFAFAKDPKLSAALEGLGTLSVSAKKSDEDTDDEQEEEKREEQDEAQEEPVGA